MSDTSVDWIRIRRLKHFLARLSALEGLLEDIQDELSYLASEFDVPLSTPYPGENIGDVRRVITKTLDRIRL